MTTFLDRYPALDRFDQRLARFMGHVGIATLRIAVALVFIWFGGLKLFEGLSPAEDLVKATVYWVNPDVFFPILGVWEVLIGIGLLWRPLVRGALFLLALQMPGTFLPLVLLPEVCFTAFPFGLTMEGQYIVKNLVIIAAALVVGSTVRARSTPEQRL
ncbi:MAG: hypothetical protein AAGF99_01915 [Bacteroidota bacterium]